MNIMLEYRANGVSWMHGTVPIQACSTHGLCVSDLLPSKSKQADALVNNILRLTEAELKGYEVTDFPDDVDGRSVEQPWHSIALDEVANIFHVDL